MQLQAVRFEHENRHRAGQFRGLDTPCGQLLSESQTSNLMQLVPPAAQRQPALLRRRRPSCAGCARLCSSGEERETRTTAGVGSGGAYQQLQRQRARLLPIATARDVTGALARSRVRAAACTYLF
jgi:hypothetical protein